MKPIRLRKYSYIIYLFVSILIGNSSLFAQNKSNSGSSGSSLGWVPGQVLLALDFEETAYRSARARMEKALQAYGLEVLENMEKIRVAILAVPPGKEDHFVEIFDKIKGIRAEKDFLVVPADTIPNDSQYSNAWHLPKINMPAAWDCSKGEGMVVAILDTGLDTLHADLKEKYIKGWNAVDLGDNFYDIHGHGTRVAGAAAAHTANGIGVASVGWHAMILPIRVSNDASTGTATWGGLTRGLEYAANQGAVVANMSYEVSSSLSVKNAAQYLWSKGGIAVASAGNQGTEHTYANYPYILVIGATTSSDTKASFSNTGNFLDFCAPGVSIRTTSRGGGYSSVNGTSLSAPIFSAVIALMKAANPNLGPSDYIDILKNTAVDLGTPGWDKLYGWGRVDAQAAVCAAMSLSGPDMTAVLQHVSCHGGNSGSITLTVTGGTVPYTYSWSNGAAVKDLSGLTAGSYTVTVTDASGVSSIKTYTITQPSALSVAANHNDVSCSGTADGTATATVSGGIASYTYAWNTSPVQTTATATGLSAGSYTVTVTDGNACTASRNVTISAPDALTVITSHSDVSCNGFADAVATAIASGGTASYTYAWNTSPMQTTATATGLSAGSYTVTVTDGNGCSETVSETITEPSALSLTLSSFPSSGNDGTTTALISGGTPPYTYFWNNGETTATINQLPSGWYAVTITDSNGCTIVDSVEVELNASTSLVKRPEHKKVMLKIFPNPASENLYLEIENNQKIIQSTEVVNLLGKLVYYHSGLQPQIDLRDFLSGVYFVRISTATETTIQRVMIIK